MASVKSVTKWASVLLYVLDKHSRRAEPGAAQCHYLFHGGSGDKTQKTKSKRE
jgi:hypothetical protein